jgi:hypothetical protein
MKLPNEFTENHLKRVGVTIVSAASLKLRCDRCLKIWVVNRMGLRLPKGYWRCPEGCNAPINSRPRKIHKIEGGSSQ